LPFLELPPDSSFPGKAQANRDDTSPAAPDKKSQGDASTPPAQLTLPSIDFQPRESPAPAAEKTSPPPPEPVAALPATISPGDVIARQVLQVAIADAITPPPVVPAPALPSPAPAAPGWNSASPTTREKSSGDVMAKPPAIEADNLCSSLPSAAIADNVPQGHRESSNPAPVAPSSRPKEAESEPAPVTSGHVEFHQATPTPLPVPATPTHANPAPPVVTVPPVTPSHGEISNSISSPTPAPRADTTPALPDPASKPPLNDVQAARLVNHAGQSEMHIDVRTPAFGTVEVHTVVRESQVGLAVGSERGDLRSFLGPELPALQSTLRQQELQFDGVRFLGQSPGLEAGLSGGNPHSFFSQQHAPSSSAFRQPFGQAKSEETDKPESSRVLPAGLSLLM
jgi:hypothetical protein